MNYNYNDEISDIDLLTNVIATEDKELYNGLLNMKHFHNNLSIKLKYLNEDFNILGYYGVIDLIENGVFLNLMKFTSICCSIINIHKEKLKILDETEDKNRYLKIELVRIEKLHGKKVHECDLLAIENSRLKETIKDKDMKVKEVYQKVKIEQNNMRNLKAAIDREKSQIQNSKYKLEKEMECLKERVNKLLTDPKRQFSSIEINSLCDRNSKSASSSKNSTLERNVQSEMKEVLCHNLKDQIQDLIFENRQLREQLVLQLMQLKHLLVENNTISLTKENLKKQKNNSGSSNSSSDSDVSSRSNETFVIQDPVSSVDERIYLELQFDVVKDDIAQSFQDHYQKIAKKIEAIGSQSMPEDSFTSKCNCSNISATSSVENISRLQKEIFQLRKRLTDYEDIIQSKDSLIESAIEQRIRRGSLVPSDI